MFDAKRNQEEIAWALAWQQGDRGAAEKLLLRYRPLIYGMRKEAARPEDWEDFKQDLALSFLTAAKAYDPRKNASFAGYIVQRIRWQGTDVFRRFCALASHEELTLEDQAELGSWETYPAETEAALTAVSRAAGLTERERQVFLAWTQGFGPGETSRLTGIPPRSVRRLRQSIRQRLDRHKEEIARILSGEE